MNTAVGGFVIMVCGAMCAGLGILMQKAPGDLSDDKKKKKRKKKKKKGEVRKAPAKTGSLVYGGGAIVIVGLGMIVWGLIKG